MPATTMNVPSCDQGTNIGDHTNGTDQFVMGGGKHQRPIRRRGGRRQTSFRHTLQKSFRMFSKRSIFGESRCSHRGVPCEQSVDDDDDGDVETDDEDEIEVAVQARINKQRRPTKTAPPITKSSTPCHTEKDENISITTRDSSLADGIPSVIYIVHDNFLAKVNKRNLLKRIQNSFRQVASTERLLLNDSDEEAYDETLVEL
jgi:hypothetical protein